MGFPSAAASKAGNLIINPSGTTPGAIEVVLRSEPWWILDMAPFRGMPAMRGENVIIDALQGRRIYPQQIDQTSYQAPFRITGECDASGNAVPASGNRVQTLYDNIDFLYANVHAPTTSGYRVIKLVDPNGSSTLASAQCYLEIGEQRVTDVLAVIDIVVAAGRI